MNKRPSLFSAPRAQSFSINSFVLIVISILGSLATLPETQPFLEYLGWAPVVGSFVIAAIIEIGRHLGNVVKDARSDDEGTYSARAASGKYYF